MEGWVAICSQKPNKMNRPKKFPSHKRPAAPAKPKPNIAVKTPYERQAERVPKDYKETMLYIPVKRPLNSSNQPSNTAKKATTTEHSQQKTASNAGKWKSTFKPADGLSPDNTTIDDINSQDSSEKAELYDPYDPGSSESESEMQQDQEDDGCQSTQDDDLGHCGYEHSSPGRGHHDNHHWDSSYCEPELDERDFSPETKPTECEGLELAEYGSVNRPFGHSGFSPDRLSPGSSTHPTFPVSYKEQETNGEERMTIPEYRREQMTTTVRLSPPRLHMDYPHPSGYVGTGVDQIKLSKKVTRNKSRSPIREVEKNHCTCELCEVEFAKMQELEAHLESKSHWDTLEHVQQHNNYDDLTIAFLQEVMLFKVRQCAHSMGESALEELRENDHMTKVEMFHCAACQVYVAISTSSVENHLSSQEHLCNKKEFGMWQRRACLAKAEAMMKELKPQFEQFLEGVDPFD